MRVNPAAAAQDLTLGCIGAIEPDQRNYRFLAAAPSIVETTKHQVQRGAVSLVQGDQVQIGCVENVDRQIIMPLLLLPVADIHRR